MEWTELQAMWQQYDARLAENTRINKEILKTLLRSKPEKRLKWMRGWAIYGMAMSIPVVCIALIPNVKFRNEWDFYLGLFLVILFLAGALYRTIQNYLLIRDIDFTNQVAKTKKQLIQLEEFRFKTQKISHLSLVVGMVGVCVLAQLPVMTKRFIGLTIFIILMYVITIYTQSKHFKNQLNNFNTELDDIEQLEKK